MPKQPYIPLYTGDYLKDTRSLPLNVRGAWVDLMIFMWEAKCRGVLINTMPEYAQMMSCTFEEANLVIGLLQQKQICDFEIMADGFVKLISRRMVRDAKLSKVRAKAGKKGMKSRYSREDVCNNKTDNKTLTTSDNDIDNDNEVELKNKKESVPRGTKPDVIFYSPDIDGEEIILPFDTQAMRDMWARWKKYRWHQHSLTYGMMGEQAALKQLQGMDFPRIEATILKAIEAKWQNLYPEKQNGTSSHQTGNKNIDHLAGLAADHAQRYGAGGTGNKT